MKRAFIYQLNFKRLLSLIQTAVLDFTSPGDEDTGKNKRIEQRVLFIVENQKKSRLVEELKALTSVDKIICFVNSKKQGDSLAYHLESLDYHVGILHGGKSQDQVPY